jgi:hypothetical protein
MAGAFNPDLGLAGFQFCGFGRWEGGSVSAEENINLFPTLVLIGLAFRLWPVISAHWARNEAKSGGTGPILTLPHSSISLWTSDAITIRNVYLVSARQIIRRPEL